MLLPNTAIFDAENPKLLTASIPPLRTAVYAWEKYYLPMILLTCPWINPVRPQDKNTRYPEAGNPLSVWYYRLLPHTLIG